MTKPDERKRTGMPNVDAFGDQLVQAARQNAGGRRRLKRFALPAAVVGLGIPASLAIAAIQETPTIGPAQGALQAFCSDAPCELVPTDPTLGEQHLRDAIAHVTPISECPEAQDAYEEAGHDIDGFVGPCPSAEDLKDISPPSAESIQNTERAVESFLEMNPQLAPDSKGGGN